MADKKAFFVHSVDILGLNIVLYDVVEEFRTQLPEQNVVLR